MCKSPQKGLFWFVEIYTHQFLLFAFNKSLPQPIQRYNY